MKHDNRGRWPQGTSGNPAGRPRGSTQVAKLRASLLEEVPDVLLQLVQRAKEGDIQAAKLILERVMPALKPEPMTAELDLPIGSGLAVQAKKVVQSLAAGTLPPG